MFLPIGDDNTRRTSFPFVTSILVIANVVVFFLELQGGQDFVTRYAVVPSHFTSGGSIPFFNIITAMFMHGGWAHLLGNMLYLYVFGDNVEDNLGKVKFVLFYFLCGILATVAQILTDPTSTVANLGASGAISGVLAGYLVLYPPNRVRVLMAFTVVNMSAWLVLGLWIATQIFAGYTSTFHSQTRQQGGIAYTAHIVGFFVGVILVLIMRRRRPPQGFAARF